eukprot:2484421-Rhodomonas_salina.1
MTMMMLKVNKDDDDDDGDGVGGAGGSSWPSASSTPSSVSSLPSAFVYAQNSIMLEHLTALVCLCPNSIMVKAAHSTSLICSKWSSTSLLWLFCLHSNNIMVKPFTAPRLSALQQHHG